MGSEYSILAALIFNLLLAEWHTGIYFIVRESGLFKSIINSWHAKHKRFT